MSLSVMVTTKYRQNNRNTTAYQGRKMKAGYTANIRLAGLNRLNTLRFRLNLPLALSYRPLTSIRQQAVAQPVLCSLP